MAQHYGVNVQEIVNRWGTTCYLCGEDVDLDAPHGPKAANVDHMIPLSRGGPTDLTNLRLVHYACNLHKHTSLVSAVEATTGPVLDGFNTIDRQLAEARHAQR